MLNIVLVCVLYKRKISDSETYNSVLEIAPKFDGKLNVNMVLFDNGDEPQPFIETSTKNITVSYHCACKNVGLAPAYNYALSQAVDKEIDWLITMDQDTIVTEEYFDKMIKAINSCVDDDVVAFVPKIVNFQDVFISPLVGKNLWSLKKFPRDTTGIVDALVAVNSGSIMSVKYIQSIGGYCELFSIDCLDNWVFKRIELDKKKVFVLDCFIRHDMVGADIEVISKTRQDSIVKSTALYIKLMESRYSRYILAPLYYFRGIGYNLLKKYSVKGLNFTIRKFMYLVFVPKSLLIKNARKGKG